MLIAAPFEAGAGNTSHPGRGSLGPSPSHFEVFGLPAAAASPKGKCGYRLTSWTRCVACQDAAAFPLWQRRRQLNCKMSSRIHWLEFCSHQPRSDITAADCFKLRNNVAGRSEIEDRDWINGAAELQRPPSSGPGRCEAGHPKWASN